MLIGNQIPTRPQPRKARTLLQVQRSEVIWIWRCLALPWHPQQIHLTPQPTWLLEEVQGLLRATHRSQRRATLAGAVTALVADFCAGVSGSDEMPGCIAPSASLVFGTEEAGSRDIREGLRLLDKGSDEGKNPREREKSFLPFSVSPTF